MKIKEFYELLRKIRKLAEKEIKFRETLKDEKGQWKLDRESKIEFRQSIGRQEGIESVYVKIQDWIKYED